MRVLAACATLALALPASPTPMAVGQRLQPFVLSQATGQDFDLGSVTGRKAYVLAFIAARCPVSDAYNARLSSFANAYAAKGVTVVGINSNREESPAEIAEHARKNGLAFPILKDDGNRKADELGAQVTPEVYVFDARWTLRYRGRIDEDRSGSAVPGADLKAAVDAVLEDREVRLKQTRAFGCAIKRVASEND